MTPSLAAPADTGLLHGAPAITRRRLLAVTGATLGLAATVELARVVPDALLPSPSVYARSRFTALLGRPVTLHPDGAPALRVRLEKILDLTVPALAGSEDAFMLQFRGPALPRLAQDVVTVRAAGLAPVRLLVVPGGLPRRGQTYFAVINRTHPPRPGGGSR